MLNLNEKAPDFTLFDTQKNPITLSGLKGKNVLLHFFPLAFTGVCTAQLCNARDTMDYYNNVNAVVLGISTDSIFSLAEFKKQQSLNFELLSDYNKDVIINYGMNIEEFAFGMKGVSARGTYIIDKEGLIKYAERTENPGVLPNFEAIKQCLSELS